MNLLSIVALNHGAWRHPWRTVARWNGRRKRWEAQVNPGLLNGLDPTITLDREDWPRGFKVDGDSADVPLASRPVLPLTSFRTPSPVPDYFLARGVVEPPKLDLSGDLLAIETTGLLDAAASGRQLRACDVVLLKDKPVMTTEWTTGAGIDGTIAQFSVGIAAATGRNPRGRIVMRAEYIPPPLTSMQALLTGGVTTEGIDEPLLATVFFLSPRGVGLDAMPDAKWSAHVQHHCFWNLHYGMRQLEPPLKKQNLTLNTGLAGGVGDALNNFILAQVNDANSAAAEFLGREQLETRIWSV